MMPPTINVSHDPDEDRTKKAKCIFRYMIHLLHLDTAILSLSIVIINLVSSSRSPFVLYLVPMIVCVVIIELCYLFRHVPPKKLRESFYGHPSIRRRAFHYQLAGVIGIALSRSHHWWDDLLEASMGVSITVYVIGVVLFCLGYAAHEFGFEDWLEDPEPEGSVALGYKSVEDLSRSLASP
jgi:hypothetical protein